jgi:hypothetical protein
MKNCDYNCNFSVPLNVKNVAVHCTHSFCHWFGKTNLDYNLNMNSSILDALHFVLVVGNTSAKCKIVQKLWLNDTAILNSHTNPSRNFQKLLEAPKQAECKMMCFSDALRVYSDASKRFWSSSTQYKNILKRMKSFSECDKIMPLSCYSFEASGTTALVPKVFPVHLKPDCLWVIIDNVYIEEYNLIDYYSVKHLNGVFESDWFKIQWVSILT